MNAAILSPPAKGTGMARAWTKLFLEVPDSGRRRTTCSGFDDAECIGKLFSVVRAGGCGRPFLKLAEKISFSKTPSTSSSRHRTPGFGLETVWSAFHLRLKSWRFRMRRGLHERELICRNVRARMKAVRGGAQPVTDTVKESADGRFISARSTPVAAVGSVQRRRRSALRSSAGRWRKCAHRDGFTDDTAGLRVDWPAVRLGPAWRPIRRSRCRATCRSLRRC